MNKHVGSQVSWKAKVLGTERAVESAFLFLTLVCVLFPFNRLVCRCRGLFAGRLTDRVGLNQPVLAAVCLHVLGKSKFFATLGAAEGFLASVKILMLMEEAAVLETLPADIAQVRPAVVCVLAAVILHDGVVFENHAALWAFIGFESHVASLVEAQGHGVWESLIALLTCKDAFLGMGHHVFGDRHLKLEFLAAQGAVVRLFYCIIAVVVPQLTNCREDPLTFCALKSALLARCLLLWGQKLLLPLPVLVSVFNEAAAVLEGKAAFFTGEGRELVLVSVKVAVKVERLAAVECLPALFAHQTVLFMFRHCIGVLLSVCLLIIFTNILCAVRLTSQTLSRQLL